MLTTSLRLFILFIVNAVVSTTALAQSSIKFTETEIQQLQAHGPWPVEFPSDPGNELSALPWAVQLGERFFNDKNLSGPGTVSCADCHQADKGFTDGLAVAQGTGTHVRNTQGLLNIALQRWLGWDGGADSLWAASLRPMFNDIEMQNTEQGVADYIRTLPESTWQHASLPSDSPLNIKELDANQLSVLVAKTIAAYMRTLRSPETEFDRFRTALLNNKQSGIDEYPDAAKRGLKLFLGEANCWLCHFGPNFSNGEFHDIGRPFLTGVGQVDPGRYTGIKRLRQDPYNLLGAYAQSATEFEKLKTESVKLGQSNWGEWRTPSLRNLSLTTPYMHDGSIPTLRGVVDAYADIDPDRLHTDGEAILKPLDLSEQQREDLVTFLLTLSP
jgi:cytochrome c peroxidase